MFYKPESGCMWDPSVLWYNGSYYMTSMYKKAVDSPDDFMWLARSADGVHWQSVGAVLEDPVGVCKMYPYMTDNGVAVNFGSFDRPDRKDNNRLRFYHSDDMIHWTWDGETAPDARWYNTDGRWDHMYVYREKDGEYYGYPVATPLPQLRSAWGLCRSTDGIRWQTCPPPEIRWGDVPRIDCLEGGGVEKLGDHYYYIGGFVGYAGNYGYGMYVFRADDPTGPFEPDAPFFRLCGFEGIENRIFVQNLAAFVRGKDGEILISNAMLQNGLDDVWLLPMRTPVQDENGHLHLGYWHGNDAVKGDGFSPDASAMQMLFVDHPETANGCDAVFTPAANGGFTASCCYPQGPVVYDRFLLTVLQEQPDPARGFVWEGTLLATSAPARDLIRCRTENWRAASVGFYLEETNGTGMVFALEVGPRFRRYSHIEQIMLTEEDLQCKILDTIGENCAEVRGIDESTPIHFRLLCRQNMAELYVNDLLVQSYLHTAPPSGRIGLLLQNASVTVTQQTIFPMTL